MHKVFIYFFGRIARQKLNYIVKNMNINIHIPRIYSFVYVCTDWHLHNIGCDAHNVDLFEGSNYMFYLCCCTAHMWFSIKKFCGFFGKIKFRFFIFFFYFSKCWIYNTHIVIDVKHALLLWICIFFFLKILWCFQTFHNCLDTCIIHPYTVN